MKTNELYNSVLNRLLRGVECVNDTPDKSGWTSKNYYEVDIIAWLVNKLTKSVPVAEADYVIYKGTVDEEDGSCSSSVEARVRLDQGLVRLSDGRLRGAQYAGFAAKMWKDGYQPYADRVSCRPVGSTVSRASRREMSAAWEDQAKQDRYARQD